MREITKLMINDFKIRELNHDFMGYSLQKGDIYTFHHLLVARRNGGSYSYWNGAILCSTPHRYLHIIESYDKHRFDLITSEMQDMKVKGFLDDNNLKNIGELLSEFEYVNWNRSTVRHKKLIHDTYLNRKFK